MYNVMCICIAIIHIILYTKPDYPTFIKPATFQCSSSVEQYNTCYYFSRAMKINNLQRNGSDISVGCKMQAQDMLPFLSRSKTRKTK